MKRWIPVVASAFVAAAVVSASAATQVSTIDLVDEDYRAGRISLDERVLFKMQALMRPELVPERYKTGTPVSDRCATPIINEFYRSMGELTPGVVDQVVTMVRARPANDTYLETEHFRVHFDFGWQSYANTVGVNAERSRRSHVDTLGYQEPPPDGGAGGNNLYDVYLQPLSGGTLGYTAAESFIPPAQSYIVLDTDLDFDLRKTVMAHEHFHSCQFTYDVGADDWWAESTAVWSEDQTYDEINDYFARMPEFYDQPEMSLADASGLHEYSACVFPIFLSENYFVDLIRESWAYAGSMNGWSSVKTALNDHGEEIENAFRIFTTWNHMIGCWKNPQSYSEGHAYGQVDVMASHIAYPVVDATTNRLMADRSSNYILFETTGAQGPMTISFNGDDGHEFRVSLITLDLDGNFDASWEMELDGSQDASIEIPDSENYTRVIMIPSVVSTSGSGISYTYSADVPDPGASPYVLLYDGDDGDRPFNGNGDDFNRCDGQEIPLKTALLENGIVARTVYSLPDDLSPYDAVFYVGGYYVGGASEVFLSDSECDSLSAYLDAGGHMYVEEPFFGSLYWTGGTASRRELFLRFSCDYSIGAPVGNVETLYGEAGSSLTDGMSFAYDYGDFPDVYVGKITPKDGFGAELVFTDQGSDGRGTAYTDLISGSKRVCLPIMLGGVTDAGAPSTRSAFIGNVLQYMGVTTGTGVGDSHHLVLGGVSLLRSYPNPFNPLTTLTFVVPGGADRMALRIYNPSGRLVRELLTGSAAEGEYNVVWDGTDARGKAVSSGVYFARLVVDDAVRSSKLVLLK